MTDANPEGHLLPAVPTSPVDGEGHPLVGVYAGALDEVRWGYPTGFWHGQVRRALGRRRWFQAGFTDGDALTVARLSDDGLTGGAFLWRVDLRTGRDLLATHVPGLPLANVKVGPIAGVGTDAFARLPHARVRLHRADADAPWRLDAFTPGHSLEASLDPAGGPIPMVLIGQAGPIDGIYAQRFVGLRVSGRVRLRSDMADLGANALGWLEYANGFYPKPIAWVTATMTAPGLHVVLSDLEGIGGPSESAAWHGELPRALGRARFSDWGGSGGLEVPTEIAPPSELEAGGPLRFEPRAVREVATGIGPSAARWRVAAGWFSGRVAGRVLDRVPGLIDVRTLGR
jgi:hypothetical protein